jgi:hypothetical protein
MCLASPWWWASSWVTLSPTRSGSHLWHLGGRAFCSAFLHIVCYFIMLRHDTLSLPRAHVHVANSMSLHVPCHAGYLLAAGVNWVAAQFDTKLHSIDVPTLRWLNERTCNLGSIGSIGNDARAVIPSATNNVKIVSAPNPGMVRCVTPGNIL